jgi:excisionase family DNA binding protein
VEPAVSVHSTGLSKHELRGLLPRGIGHNKGPPLDPLTVTVAEVQRLTGLGLTTIWKLIAKKQLESVLVGRRRLIVYASLRRLLTPNDDNQVTQDRSAAARRLRARRRKEKRETARPEQHSTDR